VKRWTSLLAVLAVVLSANGCCCFRKSQPVAAAMPVCPPVNPCAPYSGAVTYGMPTTSYLPAMQ